MTAALSFPRHEYTYADFIHFSLVTEQKHEFFDGQIIAMGGGTPEHAKLMFEVGYQLRRQLEGSPCQFFSSELLVRAKATGLATYADATIVCGPIERDPEDPKGLTVINPTVLVEVTSPTSEKRDRGKKLDHYKTIRSLHTVVIVLHREPLIEIHERGMDAATSEPGDSWYMRSAKSGRVELHWLSGITIDIDALYAAIRDL